MLTVTYALVTLSVEQKKARNILSVLQRQIRTITSELQSVDKSGFESLLYQLVQFDEDCRWRNVELYMIPALRKVTRQADGLIEELEALSASGAVILRTLRDRLWIAFGQGAGGIAELCDLAERYCHKLMQRLAKEDEELFPIAQREISGEEWFEIAAKFISHDAEMHAHKTFVPRRPRGHAQAGRAASSYQISG